MLQKRIADEYDFRPVKANKKLEANGVGLPSTPEILERMSSARRRVRHRRER